MIAHTCGYEEEMYCRRCDKPLAYREKTGIFCPSCGHEVTLICPRCGKRW